MRSSPFPFAVVGALACCAAGSPASSAPRVDTSAIARQAHEAYVRAINANDIDSLLAMCTDDIVYLSPHEPVVAGKAAVRAWAEAYLGAYTIHWDKTTDEFIVAGDWVYERYSYKEDDAPKGGGAHLVDAGKGINIYHHDADGVWRVSRDAWNSDLPPAPAASGAPAGTGSPIVYFEIAGPDGQTLRDFYANVFAWRIDATSSIDAASTGGVKGGIRQDPTEKLFYLGVPDIAATLARIQAAGGKTVLPRTVVPGVVTFAIFTDPAGNRMGLAEAGSFGNTKPDGAK